MIRQIPPSSCCGACSNHFPDSGPDARMPTPGASWKGLRLQLAFFYLLISIPALVLVEQTVLAFEFQRCVQELDDGRVQRRLQAEADQLGAALAAGIATSELDQRLRRFVLELERPRESLGTEAAYVLLELAAHPFTALLVPADNAVTEPALPADNLVRRRWQAPLIAGSQALRLELAVPSPWQHLNRKLSFEWPIAVAYLTLFLVGSAWFLGRRVLVRVERMGWAARAWARGDFQPHLADDSGDELGQVARDLDRMAADLKALFAARSQLATLEERRRLARDLHDTVKQKMFALSLQIAAAQQSQHDAARLGQRLVESVSLVEEIQRELSDMLRELREDAGAVEDLIPALQRRLADFGRRSGLKVREELPERLSLAPTEAETVLRIVDEALANAWRHSHSTLVKLTLNAMSTGIVLAVSDDGVGGAADSPTGMGLDNMRQRAGTLPDGKLSIESPPGGGTMVSLRFNPETK